MNATKPAPRNAMNEINRIEAAIFRQKAQVADRLARGLTTAP